MERLRAFSLKKAKPRWNGSKGSVETASILVEEMPSTPEEALAKHPYFAAYMGAQDVKPRYLAALDRSLGDEEDANLVYPLGLGIYAHVRVGGEINTYNVIEPPPAPEELLTKVESAVASIVKDSDISLEPGVEVDKEKVLTSLFMKTARNLNIPREERDNVLYYFLREKIRFGFLDGLLEDQWLEDISVPGAGNIFVYHKIYGNMKTNVVVSMDKVDRLLKGIAERYGKVLSYTNPIIDIHLPDGSRFNVVFGEDISLKGSNFTIRKFSKDPISVAHLIRWGTITPEMGAYMWMLQQVGISCFFCGETASGKTTSMNALTGLVKSDNKIVSIEETPEVNVFHKNWVREVTRMHTGTKVTMFDLLKAALRQRPDLIIVGEIRGEEGRIAFQAIETGHPVMSTMHAGGLAQLFQRLTSDPINVPKTHMDGLNLAIFQARMERKGRLIRRTTSVNEIIGYDTETGSLNFLPTFIYDADMDSLNFLGSSYLMEVKVLPFRGWAKERLPELYEELRIRTKILHSLSENLPSYLDVWRTVIEAEHRGVDEVYKRMRDGGTPWES
jgi:flagellar protein FlaI